MDDEARALSRVVGFWLVGLLAVTGLIGLVEVGRPALGVSAACFGIAFALLSIIPEKG